MGEAISSCVQDSADGDGLSSAISDISEEISSAVTACVAGDGPDLGDVDERGDFMTLPQDDERRSREVALENTLNRSAADVSSRSAAVADHSFCVYQTGCSG